MSMTTEISAALGEQKAATESIAQKIEVIASMSARMTGSGAHGGVRYGGAGLAFRDPFDLSRARDKA